MPELQTVYDYMRAYGPELSERILNTYHPLHAPEDPVSPLLKTLRRPLLSAQELVVMALAKYLRKNDSAKLVGECGTGKTFMSLAACYVHSAGRRHTGLVMCAPHLVEKWAREVFTSLPRTRVFIIHDLRNGGDPKKPHGITEVVLRHGKVVRTGWAGSLTELRSMGRVGWGDFCREPAWFILGREKGKLSYFWKHVYSTAKSGRHRGSVVNPDTCDPILNSEGESLFARDFDATRRSERITRPKGTILYSPLWSADNAKLQRMAPLEYIGRYLKGWWDYALADEMHELNGDTAQGNGCAVLQRASRRMIGMSGTLMGGYADDLYNLLYRLDPPRMAGDGWAWGTEGRRSFQETYGTIEEIRRVYPEDNKCSRAGRVSVVTRRRPGASPLLFGRYLMESTAFIFLEDIAERLPGYEEQVVPVGMSEQQAKAYRKLEDDIRHALSEYPKAKASIASLMLNTLMLYPDHPYGIDPLVARVRDQNGFLERVEIGAPAELDENVLYPKEQELIRNLREDLARGRRGLVYATYTGKHDVTHRLEQVLRGQGFRVAVMRRNVPTDKREVWMEARVGEGVEVAICHPRLVQTGLDLLWFPSLHFYETGYSLYTLRQASRRSWRIGQYENVMVKFYSYRGTMQERCLRLMGKKLMVSLAMEGKFTGEGLQDFEDDEASDILTALARELVTDAHVGESADAVWKSLERERAGMIAATRVLEIGPGGAGAIDVAGDQTNNVLSFPAGADAATGSGFGEQLSLFG